MAMTKTTAVETIEIRVREGDDQITVHYVHTWDDPDDSDAPVNKVMTKGLQRYTRTTSTDEDGNEVTTTTETDLSGEDQLVQDIAAVVWS